MDIIDNYKFRNKNVIVVGGTQGIGSGIAIKLSSLGANILIGGRNETLGNKILKKMINNQKNNDNIHVFKKIDQSIPNDIKNFTNEVYNVYEKIDYLIISSGKSPNSIRKETDDGIEEQFATNGLGRFLITYLLIPLLEKSETPKVFIIGGGGRGTNLDLNDIELKKSEYSTIKAAKRNLSYLDSITNEFSRRYKNITFYGFYPPLVKTNLVYNSGYGAIIGKITDIIFYFIGYTIEEYAKKFIEIMNIENKNKNEAVFINNNILGGINDNIFGKINQVKSSDWCYDKDNAKILWDYSINIAKIGEN